MAAGLLSHSKAAQAFSLLVRAFFLYTPVICKVLRAYHSVRYNHLVTVLGFGVDQSRSGNTGMKFTIGCYKL
jgi:hypothetical protein